MPNPAQTEFTLLLLFKKLYQAQFFTFISFTFSFLKYVNVKHLKLWPCTLVYFSTIEKWFILIGSQPLKHSLSWGYPVTPTWVGGSLFSLHWAAISTDLSGFRTDCGSTEQHDTSAPLTSNWIPPKAERSELKTHNMLTQSRYTSSVSMHNECTIVWTSPCFHSFDSFLLIFCYLWISPSPEHDQTRLDWTHVSNSAHESFFPTR